MWNKAYLFIYSPLLCLTRCSLFLYFKKIQIWKQIITLKFIRKNYFLLRISDRNFHRRNFCCDKFCRGTFCLEDTSPQGLFTVILFAEMIFLPKGLFPVGCFAVGKLLCEVILLSFFFLCPCVVGRLLRYVNILPIFLPQET